MRFSDLKLFYNLLVLKVLLIDQGLSQNLIPSTF